LAVFVAGVLITVLGIVLLVVGLAWGLAVAVVGF
jgi:hypothetical protein